MKTEKRYNQIDVTGKAWSITVGNIPNGLISVMHQGIEVSLFGPIAVCLPPYSIVEWKVEKGSLNFSALFCDLDVPDFFPNYPLAFHPSTLELPLTKESLKEFIASGRDFRGIYKEDLACPLSRRLRDYLDKNFAEKTSFKEIAQALGYSHSVMTRYFARCYGIPPIVYRNRLRVSESLRLLILQQYDVTKSGMSVGFDDLSLFNRTFKRQNHTNPSSFKN